MVLEAKEVALGLMAGNIATVNRTRSYLQSTESVAGWENEGRELADRVP